MLYNTGVTLVNSSNGVVVCETQHFTSFGVLLGPGGKIFFTHSHPILNLTDKFIIASGDLQFDGIFIASVVCVGVAMLIVTGVGLWTMVFSKSHGARLEKAITKQLANKVA